MEQTEGHTNRSTGQHVDSASTFAACSNCLKLNKISVARAHHAKPLCGHCKKEIDVVGAIVNANGQQLKKMIEHGPLPVVVDFWAPWCGPCRAFAPTFTSVAESEAGRATFVKVNTEDNIEVSQTFGIRGIPTLAVFKGGYETDRLGGALPAEQFRMWVRQQLR